MRIISTVAPVALPVVPAAPASAEELATLLCELEHTGRYAGSGAVLIQPTGALVTIDCVVKIDDRSRRKRRGCSAVGEEYSTWNTPDEAQP